MTKTEAIYSQYAVYIDTVFRMELKKQRDAGIWVNHEDEEDLHQRVLVKVIKYIPRFNPSQSSIKTYLYNIVKSQLRWNLIDMRGMDGRRMSKEAWNNSMLHYDEDGFDELEQPEAESMETVYSLLDDQQRKFCRLVMDEGYGNRRAMRAVGVQREEEQEFLSRLHEAIRGESL